MDRIHYAGDAFVTGTDIALALLDYAQALASVGGSATVMLPTLNDDGSPGRSQVLVGPSSQLASSQVDSEFDELVDAELAERLRSEAARIRKYGADAPRADLAELDDWSDDTGWTDDTEHEG